MSNQDDLYRVLSQMAKAHAEGSDHIVRIEANAHTMDEIWRALTSNGSSLLLPAPSAASLFGVPMVVVPDMAPGEWRAVRNTALPSLNISGLVATAKALTNVLDLLETRKEGGTP